MAVKPGEKQTPSIQYLENVTVRPWERRVQTRFKQREAARKYTIDSIDVRITTVERRYGASLVDLSIGGVGVVLATPLPIGMPVGVELQIGQYTVTALGVVRSVMKKGNLFRLGVQFVQLGAAEREFLRFLELPEGRV